MNNIIMKKASILAVIAVTALSMSACGDTKKNEESKKDTTSSVAAAVEVSTSDEEVAVTPAPVESKVEEAPKVTETAEKIHVEFNNNAGVAITLIQVLDKDGKCIADLIEEGAFISTGMSMGFEIPSGQDLTIRYGTEDTTIFDIKGVNTSDYTYIQLCRNVNEPSLECMTKDGETVTIKGKYVSGFEYSEYAPGEIDPNYNDNTYDYNNYDDTTDYNNYDNNVDYNNGGDTYTDNGGNGDGGCVGDDAFTF